MYDSQSKALPSSSYTWSTGVPHAIQPGETATYLSGTSARDVFMIQQTDRKIDDVVRPLSTVAQNQKEDAYEFFTLNNEKKDFHITATEDDRGGFGILQFFVKNNRLYTNSHIIAVPWTNKQLNISFTTFRDKMEPGSQEKWEVKINGTKGEKVTAEMLATMYDASLDQFKPHNWSLPAIWPEYHLGSYWNGRQNFIQVQSVERNDTEGRHISFTKNYDRLIDIGVYPRLEMMKFAPPSIVKDEEARTAKRSLSGRVAGISAEQSKVAMNGGTNTTCSQ